MTHCIPRAAAFAAAIVAAAVAIIVVAVPAAAQNDDDTAGRIIARKLADGRVEFGWQPTGGGQRVLPRQRYFPTDAQVDRWLRSSSVEIFGTEIGQINARLLDDGRIEFAFTPTDEERILPSARYFPADARVGRWLRSTEIAISSPLRYTAVSAGYGNTCGLRGDGAITCWRRGDREQSYTRMGNYTAVDTGYARTCGLRSDKEIECWSVWSGNRTTDVPAGRFTAVSVGYDHACAIRESGEVECWGNPRYDDGQTDAPRGRFAAVSAGYSHTCAIHEGGRPPQTVECWGSDHRGERYPTYDTIHFHAPSFRAVSAGAGHTCGLFYDYTINCWGYNGYGQADAPAGRLSAVSAGGYHTCALHGDGVITCWGDDTFGQSSPLTSGFAAVSAGSTHTCGLRENGEIECWGNSGVSAPPLHSDGF